MHAYFDRFSIIMTLAQAKDASHQGRCDEDVNYLCSLPAIKRQLGKISDEDLKSELSGYGAWSDEDLEDRTENEERIIWISAGNIQEENRK
jgi:hypothetical protein